MVEMTRAKPNTHKAAVSLTFTELLGCLLSSPELFQEKFKSFLHQAENCL